MLENAWFLIWCLLWAVYLALDGFDLGLGVLMPFVARDARERNVIYNSTGPFWDGNEVWLIAAGGVTFAAFPKAYAVMFSALYAPLMLILFALIIRGAALGLRGEAFGEAGRKAWDRALFAGSLAASVMFGIVFANIFSGVPIDAMGVYHGTLAGLLNPFGLLGGTVFLVFFLLDGCLWLAVKSDGDLRERCARLAWRLWIVLVVSSFGFLAAANAATEIWARYEARPALLAIPGAAAILLLATGAFTGRRAWGRAWAACALFMVAFVFFGFMGLYPALLPSSLDPAFSITIQNSASSPLTLKIMLGVVAVFLPLVIGYQIFAYRVFRGRADSESYGH